MRTSYYGCGGYITKGAKICKIGLIPQRDLEAVVIGAVLNFYAPCLAEGGRKRLAEAVKAQMGTEHEELGSARARGEAEHDRITRIIDNLLDNLTETNRQYVDERLEGLTDQRRQIEKRLEELDRLASSQAEITSIAADALKFLSGLAFTLREGLPQEKLVALRQCIQQVYINAPDRVARIRLFTVPAGSLTATEEVQVSIGLVTTRSVITS